LVARDRFGLTQTSGFFSPSVSRLPGGHAFSSGSAQPASAQYPESLAGGGAPVGVIVIGSETAST
jgi:hypothetical protein